MGEQENVKTVERMWEAVQAKDWDGALSLLHPDFVQEWPQSGERLRGKNAMEVNKNYPGFPTMTPRRTLGGSDLVVQEVTLDYGRGPVHMVSILEFVDDKIIRETDYFADPFEAPEWRAQWVERM